jgi:Protein of unknown function (DUF4230)
MGVLVSASAGPHRSAGRLFAGFLLGAAVVAAGFGVVVAAGWLPELVNPFDTRQVDRTGPAVLDALDDLSEYHAAQGTYQVLVDVEEDSGWLPSALSGERTVLQATGSVDAVVDLSGLGADAIEVSEDGTGVTITIPEARLSEPRIDPANSRVIDRERGLLDRIGGVFSDTPTDDQDLFVVAEGRLTEAATESGLTERAEENTEAMLEDLLGPLGFTQVEVVFAAPPQDLG